MLMCSEKMFTCFGVKGIQSKNGSLWVLCHSIWMDKLKVGGYPGAGSSHSAEAFPE